MRILFLDTCISPQFFTLQINDTKKRKGIIRLIFWRIPTNTNPKLSHFHGSRIIQFQSDNTVARPQAVFPKISVWSWLNSKCSLHACFRGLKISASIFVSGSMACVLACLKLLQTLQANHKFSSSLVPSFDLGKMCSISKGIGIRCCGD